MAKRRTKKSTSYVSRASQITKKAPTKRLRKRRTKNLKSPKRGFFPNPRPLLFKITAQRSGKKMHYDGVKFSERARVKLFSTVEQAESKARDLLKRYPVLRTYRIAVESNFQTPRAA